jgi:hypothetical protein
MPPITLVATKAPSAMNTPWPKFSTSIRPNTSVRPEAMMKMIRPIARPATVSVSQVLTGCRWPAAPAARSAASRISGLPVEAAFGMAAEAAVQSRPGGCGAHWCAGPSDKAQQALLQDSSSASSAIAPVCTTRPSSITATRSPRPWPS